MFNLKCQSTENQTKITHYLIKFLRSHIYLEHYTYIWNITHIFGTLHIYLEHHTYIWNITHIFGILHIFGTLHIYLEYYTYIWNITHIFGTLRVWGIDFASVAMILVLDFEIVQTVWYFFCFSVHDWKS